MLRIIVLIFISHSFMPSSHFRCWGSTGEKLFLWKFNKSLLFSAFDSLFLSALKTDRNCAGWISSQLALYQFSVHLCLNCTVRRENDKGSKTTFIFNLAIARRELGGVSMPGRDLKSQEIHKCVSGSSDKTCNDFLLEKLRKKLLLNHFGKRGEFLTAHERTVDFTKLIRQIREKGKNMNENLWWLYVVCVFAEDNKHETREIPIHKRISLINYFGFRFVFFSRIFKFFTSARQISMSEKPSAWHLKK